jgi:hypothetical protein
VGGVYVGLLRHQEQTQCATDVAWFCREVTHNAETTSPAMGRVCCL